MANNSTLEDMREARDTIRALYNAAHSLACNDPHCPWAQLANEPSGPTSVGSSHREEAVILILFGLAENVGECLDLLRVLVADRDETSSLTHLSPSSSSTTTSRPSTEDTYVETHEYLRSPPSPALYRDQWAQTPALSPPAYTAFFQGHHRQPPNAPVSSPATPDTTTPDAGVPVIGNKDGMGNDGQGEQNRAGDST
ncbi:hypothetical protein DHEL01_v212004 [Diaporthe helianthi]|uniref:Uncharacterized protein n=1 Tax=Diaporthe helianthi TaxID=158607 RepID=A0A2P5HH72_DIAHE|nr:hypothetical protein DHEL01_v212004 [Diaporthe helianthi]